MSGMQAALPAARTLPRVDLWRIANLLALGGVVFVAAGIVLAGYKQDAYIYWWAAHLPAGLYDSAWNSGNLQTYVYSPAFVQAIAPLGLLPWAAFYAIIVATETAALVWLAGPILAFFSILFVLPIQNEVMTGNIHLLLATAVVLGFRYPAAWAFVLLTKVVPGVGLLWFAVRREWRSLGIALGATALIAGVSFVVAPGLWGEWIGRLAASGGAAPVPLLPRLIVGAALIAYGARRDWYWTVPFAAALAMPNFALPGLALSAFVGVIGVLRGVVRLNRPEAGVGTAAAGGDHLQQRRAFGGR